VVIAVAPYTVFRMLSRECLGSAVSPMSLDLLVCVLGRHMIMVVGLVDKKAQRSKPMSSSRHRWKMTFISIMISWLSMG
jgi:hypothetical protein